MQPIDHDAAALEAEYLARQRQSLAMHGNRHERRAIAVMERREAAKRAVEQRAAPTFYGTGVTLDIVEGWTMGSNDVYPDAGTSFISDGGSAIIDGGSAFVGDGGTNQ